MLEDQSTIKLQTDLRNIESIDTLKNTGLELLQNLSGEIWSDYNIHDPGITTLEVLCYVITELGYRTETPIEDIFFSDNKIKGSFFEAHEILNSGATTLKDFKKIILDIHQVRNVKIIPSQGFKEYSSLYAIWIELMDPDVSNKQKKEVKDLIKVILSSNKTLGLDFEDIYFLDHDKIGIDLHIDLDKKVAKNKIVKELLDRIDGYFSPLPQFKTLKELQQNNYRTEEIFNGPKLKNGFLNDQSLDESKIRTHLYISDLINLIMDISPIKNIKKINLLDEHEKSYNWVYEVKNNCVARLNLRKTNIVITFQNNEIMNFSSNDFHINYAETKTNAAHKQNKISIKKGIKQDLKSFRSIQYEFPSIYGVGENGAPSSWTKERVAYVKQFKSFLTFFDQILANYFAQLSHLPALFSLNDITHTQAVQWLNDLPKQYLIFKPFLESCILKNIDIEDENQLTKEWNLWVEKNKNKQLGFLQKIIESKSVFYERRKKILDHLLARFGYDLSSFDMVSMLTDAETIEHKRKFLIDLPFIGATKYNGLSHESAKAKPLLSKGGFEHYIMNLLGFRGKAEKPISSLMEISLNRNKESAIFVIDFRESNMSEGIQKLIKYGINKDNFLKKQNHYILTDLQKNEICKISSSGEKKIESNSIANVCKNLKKASIHSESFYLFDHILFRPNERLKVFGLEINDDKKPVFISTNNLSKFEQITLQNNFKSTCHVKQAYEILEIGHNQFKVKIEALTSTHYFETRDEAVEAIDFFATFFSKFDNIDKLIKQTTKFNQIYNEVDDPFSNIISVVLPNWPHRFQSSSFKNYISKTIVEEAPAHIFVNIKWLGYEEMVQLEKSYKDYLTCTATKFKLKEKKLTEFLSVLMKND